MLALASLLAAYAGFALLHAARPSRLPAAVARQAARLPIWPPLARAGGLSFAASAAWLWSQTETGAAGMLVALVALMVAASAFVLLVPLRPRAMWGIALACPPLIAALWLLGDARGL